MSILKDLLWCLILQFLIKVTVYNEKFGSNEELVLHQTKIVKMSLMLLASLSSYKRNRVKKKTTEKEASEMSSMLRKRKPTVTTQSLINEYVTSATRIHMQILHSFSLAYLIVALLASLIDGVDSFEIFLSKVSRSSLFVEPLLMLRN